MIDPERIEAPSDIREPLVLVSGATERLEIFRPSKFNLSFHWLCEVSPGVIEGVPGLPVEAGGEVPMRLSTTGNFRKVVSLDKRQRLRLTIFKRKDHAFGFVLPIRVTRQAEMPLPHGLDDLAMAILGVHELQWLEELSRTIRTMGRRSRSLPPGIKFDLLERLFTYWSTLEPGTAAELWRSENGLAHCNSRALRKAFLAVKAHAHDRASALALERGLESLANFNGLDALVKRKLASWFGQINTESHLKQMTEALRNVLCLRDSIYMQVVPALEHLKAIELSHDYQAETEDTPLLDCSFDFTNAGLEAYRRALKGDYLRVPMDTENAQFHPSVFTHCLQTPARLELHLPFLSRRERSKRLEKVGRWEVEADAGGRLLVYSADTGCRNVTKNSYQSALAVVGALLAGDRDPGFTLSYTDKRRLPAKRAGNSLSRLLSRYGFDHCVKAWLNHITAPRVNEALSVSLNLAIPGSLAVSWLDAPDEDSPEFFEVYSRLSIAIQSAMRNWLPWIYFENLDRYRNPVTAYPVLVYQASRPFPGKPRAEFTYDVLKENGTRRVFRTAARTLPRMLVQVQRLLAAAGDETTAALYSPKKAARILALVRRRPRLLNSLLVADTSFVDGLINFGCTAHRLAPLFSCDPQKTIRCLKDLSSRLAKSFNKRLKRVCGREDFSPLFSLLLIEATTALRAATEVDPPIEATLRIADNHGEFAQTLGNLRIISKRRTYREED